MIISSVIFKARCEEDHEGESETQLKCRSLGPTRRYCDSVAQLGAQEPVSLAISGKCTPRKEMRHRGEKAGSAKVNLCQLPGCAQGWPWWRGLITVGKGISDLWVEKSSEHAKYQYCVSSESLCSLSPATPFKL